jgi:hypothetical protein
MMVEDVGMDTELEHVAAAAQGRCVGEAEL